MEILMQIVKLAFALLLSSVSVGAAHGYTFTSPTSEEFEPRTCAFNQFQSGFRCSGGFCDNVSLECHPPGISGITSRDWTAQISEEGGGIRLCPSGQFVAGISASGGSSDNLSLECVSAAGVNWFDCSWTAFVSEEGGGTLLFPGGRYAVGIQCTGSNCDNQRFFTCRTSP
jgi:hypothetical protein